MICPRSFLLPRGRETQGTAKKAGSKKAGGSQDIPAGPAEKGRWNRAGTFVVQQIAHGVCAGEKLAFTG